MNEAFRIGLTGLVVIILQVAAGPFLELFGNRPDLTLIFCLLITLRHGRLVGLFTGFIFGLALDFVSLDMIGVNAFTKSTLCFWTGMWLDDRVGSVAIGWWVILLAIASLLQGVIFEIITLQNSSISLTHYFFAIVLPGTIYTCIVGLLWAMAPMGTRSRGPLAPAVTRGRRSLR